MTNPLPFLGNDTVAVLRTLANAARDEAAAADSPSKAAAAGMSPDEAREAGWYAAGVEDVLRYLAGDAPAIAQLVRIVARATDPLAGLDIPADLLEHARSLAGSPHAEDTDPEYVRALVELIIAATPGANSDDHRDAIRALILDANPTG